MLTNAVAKSSIEQSTVRGRPKNENREPVVNELVHRPDAIWVFAGTASVDATLSIVADGKNYSFNLNRRMLMRLAKEVFAGLEKMEPGR